VKKLSLFNVFVLILNNLFALALLTSYVAWFINSSKLPVAGVVALGVPVLMGINLLFVLYWIILRKRQFFLSTFCLLLGWWHFNALYQFSPSNKAKENSEFIRVMSYNVHHYYAAFTWAKTYAKVEDMVALINETDPDIFCVQEFQSAKKWVPQERLKYKVVSNHVSTHLAIFSKYPIIHSDEVYFPAKKEEYDKFLYADILIKQDTLRVITAHLESIGLNNKDLQTFTQIENADEEKVKRSGKIIYDRLLQGYKERGVQVNSLADFISESPYPVILCGDFNDTPTSFAYKKLTSQLSDSYVLAGSGINATHTRFDHYHIPMRIDHILADKKLTPHNWQVIKKDYSDHYPVVVDYDLK